MRALPIIIAVGVLSGMNAAAGQPRSRESGSARDRPLAGAEARTYIHDVWNTETGLPQNTVTSLRQTRDGYLWIATFGGLARFDGIRFTLFSTGTSPGLGANRITHLYEDRAGGLWAAFERGGLAHYADGTFTTYTHKDGLPDSAVTHLAEDRDGRLWATTARGVAHFDRRRFVTESTHFGLPNRDLFHYFQARDGGIWLGPPEGLTRSYQGTLTNYMPRPDFIHEGADGSVWVYQDEGSLARFHEGAWTYYPLRDDLPGDPARARYAFAGRDDAINVLSGNGLTRFKDGRVISFSALKDVPTITSALEDREGNLWIGSSGTGLHRFKQTSVVAYSAESGLTDEGFMAITDDGAGGLWLGGNLFNFTAGRFVRYPDVGPIWSLLRDRQGSLWIGVYGALFRRTNGELIKYPLFDGTPVVSLYEDRIGTVWIGTLKGHVSGSPGGLYHFKDDRFSTYRTTDGLVDNNVRFITEDRGGALWIGTDGGLSSFSNGRFANYTTANGLSNNSVREIYEDEDGALWIGTYGGGLNRFANGRFARISEKEGLLDDIVSRIIEDANGYFWMSGNRGIQRVSRKELNELAHGKIPRITSIRYGVADGMKTSECNGGGQPAGWKDRDGKLWFPTIKGVVVVDPARTNQLPPPVAIEQVLIDKTPMSLSRRADAGPGRGEVEIQYTALSLVAPQRVQFKYKLEGYDAAWVDAGIRRIAYYTNLPPGRYTFRVTAANNDGVWNDTGASFEIRLRPYFYQTTWFGAVVAASLVAIASFGFRHHVARLHRRHARQQAFSRQLIESQESERKRIAAELHDSLGQSLIIIRNRALLTLTKPDDHDQALEQMNEIASAAGQAIGEVREIAYNLRPYQLDRLGLTRALQSMVGEVSASCGTHFNVEIDPLDGLLSPDQEINIYRIVQESINNIVKHSQATEAGIAIRRRARGIHITVRDNGKGFNAGAADSADPERRGFGLTGIAERTRMLEAKYRLRSEPGRGTTISITLSMRETGR